MKNSKIKIIALFGKAGAGKDTIQQWIISRHNLHGIVSCTTRPPRDYEENGVDYHFLSNEDFTRKVLNGTMLEATEFRGWFYGTPLDSLSLDKINVGVFNIAGIDALLEDTRLEVYPVIVYAPDKTRLIRQLMREESPDCEEICRRFQTDNKDFLQCDFAPFFVWENYEEEDPFIQEQEFICNFCRLLEKLGFDQMTIQSTSDKVN